jgi:hypothetical protein
VALAPNPARASALGPVAPARTLRRIAFRLLELLVGIGLIGASHRMSQRAYERRGPTLAAHLVLRFLGVLLTLHGLLVLLFALV